MAHCGIFDALWDLWDGSISILKWTRYLINYIKNKTINILGDQNINPLNSDTESPNKMRQLNISQMETWRIIHEVRIMSVRYVTYTKIKNRTQMSQSLVYIYSL